MRDLEEVGVRGEAGEIVGDELVRPLELTDDPGLPGQEIGDDLLLEPFPFELIARVEDAVAGRQVLEIRDILSPIVQAPGFVQGGGSAEYLLDAPAEHGLDMRIGGPRGMGLVIELIADDGRMVLESGDKPADDALGVKTICRMGEVGHLPEAVSVAGRVDRLHLDLGMLLKEPGGYGIGRGAQDDLDTGLVQAVDDPLEPGEIELAVARLHHAPGGFTQAHEIDPGFFHEPDVLFEPVIRHVFEVVRGAVEDRFEAGRRRRGRSRCRL